MAGQGGLAEDLRAGLSAPKPAVVRAIELDPLDKLLFRKPVRQHVREFGAVVGILLALLAGYIAWQEGSLATVGGLVSAAVAVYGAGVRAPHLLHRVWRGWMKMAEGIGVVMTMVILAIGWLCLMLPTSAVLKLLRIKVMDTNFRSPVTSYWETRDPKMDDFKLLERQF